jgi:AraC-like DNA-binding protein
MMTLTEAELLRCDEGTAMGAEPPALTCTPILLPARRFVATDDPAEAALAVREMLGEHRLSLRGPASDFHASITLAEVADLRIAYFRYGTAVDIVGAPLGRYAMNFTLHGVSRIRHGDQHAAAPTGAATIFSPVADSELTWSSDLDLLCLIIPADALGQHFRKMTGISEPVYFRPGVDPAAAHLARSMLTSILRLSEGGAVVLRNALLTTIMTELPHNHSAALRRASSPGAERTAMAAVAAMRRQLAAPPTIPHLAGRLGVSERTLLSAFHEHFSTTPSAYFKQMRLEAVRDALLHSRPQDTTVTRVAAEAGGFLHPGRFAGEYFAMFGEHPADTLRSPASGAR